MSNEGSKEKRNRAEGTVKDAKLRAGERWERELMENFQEIKNIFSKNLRCQ